MLKSGSAPVDGPAAPPFIELVEGLQIANLLERVARLQGGEIHMTVSDRNELEVQHGGELVAFENELARIHGDHARPFLAGRRIAFEPASDELDIGRRQAITGKIETFGLPIMGERDLPRM